MRNKSNGHGRGTRRRWSVEEKRRIVEESLRPGVTIGEVAQRRGVSWNALNTWRAHYRAGKFGDPRNTPEVQLVSAEPGSDVSSETGPWIPTVASNGVSAAGGLEMKLPDGTLVKLTGELAHDALRRILAMSGVK